MAFISDSTLCINWIALFNEKILAVYPHSGYKSANPQHCEKKYLRGYTLQVRSPEMGVTKQKQMRLSEEGRFLLNTCKAATGYTDTKVTEICYALYCLELRREVQRAHEFLYENLVALTQRQPHRDRDGLIARRTRGHSPEKSE
jgi:hypothetical protein